MQKSVQPTTRNTKQGGFTLIELMIVVAIIGVLASIAVPQYQNYVARAQVSEAISLASSAKTAVSEYYVTNGEFPVDNATAGLSDDTDIKGSYVQSVTVGTGGVITAKMASADVVGALIDKTLDFTPTASDADTNSGSITWKCGPGATGGIPTQYLPASCRG
ncbi:MAG: pilin [Halomonas sp. 54_146]|nr:MULTISPECIES: pilin [unclassified Halomonas]KUJ88528.1 MAG: pilin [Halomonas sp. 54_146]HAA45766.1 prepilin-type cleavage/methylation domain-containing protein [Halomonas sp.]